MTRTRVIAALVMAPAAIAAILLLPTPWLAALAARVRAHLEVELELGGAGVPAWSGGQGAPPVVIEARSPTFEPGPTPSASVLAAEPGQKLELGEKVRRLEQLAEQARDCRACRLHERRTQAVFARGSASAAASTDHRERCRRGC